LRTRAAVAIALLAAVVLGGCRDEDGRALDFDKGVYGGPPVPEPSAQAAEGWKSRLERMRF
jgi:hypothetical protein